MGPGFFLSGGSCFLFFFLDQSLPPAISQGRKCCPAVLEIKNTCSQWVGGNMHSRCLDFFSFKFWAEGVGGGFFSFFLCSLYVPFQWVPKFPMCSSRVFEVAPCFNPILVCAPCIMHRCVLFQTTVGPPPPAAPVLRILTMVLYPVKLPPTRSFPAHPPPC